MKFTINIKNSKVAFFMELVKNLDFVDIEFMEDPNGDELTTNEKKTIEQRLKLLETHPEAIKNWDQFSEEINF